MMLIGRSVSFLSQSTPSFANPYDTIHTVLLQSVAVLCRGIGGWMDGLMGGWVDG